MTRAEQLKSIEEKMAVLNARKRELEAKEREAERKARTKRLIEIGASVESALGIEIPKEDLPKFLESMKKNSASIKRDMESSAEQNRPLFLN